MIQRVNLGNAKFHPNFIGSWKMEALICDQIIDFYNNHQQKQRQGTITAGIVNLETKNRKDISLSPQELNLPGNEIFKKYFEKLFNFYKDYNNQWRF